MIDFLLPKLHKEGYRFLAIAVVITFILLLISNFLGLISFILTVWIYYFFRDPERFSINDESFLLSPADGIVSQITEVKGPEELGLENKQFTRVSIFMNVFNCHVNRSPVNGKIEEIFYKPGKFLNASLDKASEENERNFFRIKSKDGEEIIVVQIAGLIARRIVSDVSKDQDVSQGERLGIIRFGSRVDLYFEKKNLLVKKGQNVLSGETIIAEK